MPNRSIVHETPAGTRIASLGEQMRVAKQVCAHLAVMRRGRMVEYGAAAQGFGAPWHACTHALFAAAPGRGYTLGAIDS